MEIDPKPIPALIVPEYAGPERAELTENQRALARLAAWFGGLPLALGCTDFLLWVPTHADVFVYGGLCIILLGLPSTFIGAVMLLTQLCTFRGTGRLWLFFKSSGLALILLFINYPVAIGIIALVGMLGGP